MQPPNSRLVSDGRAADLAQDTGRVPFKGEFQIDRNDRAGNAPLSAQVSGKVPATTLACVTCAGTGTWW